MARCPRHASRSVPSSRCRSAPAARRPRCACAIRCCRTSPREYGVGLGTAGQTVTAFAIAYGLLQLAYGPIGDRFGKYRVVTLATPAARSRRSCARSRRRFGALVFARMLAGATAGALIPLSMAWIGDTVAYERRQAVLARFLIGQMFGIAMGQVLGGLGADHFGERPVFLVLAAWFAAVRRSCGGSRRSAERRSQRRPAATSCERSRPCSPCPGRASCCSPCSSKASCCSARWHSSRRTCIARTACR